MAEVVKEGYCDKKGTGMRPWKKWYCVLSGSQMSFYTRESDKARGTAKESVILREVTKIERDTSKKGEYRLTIDADVQHFLRFTSEVELMEWMQAVIDTAEKAGATSVTGKTLRSTKSNADLAAQYASASGAPVAASPEPDANYDAMGEEELRNTLKQVEQRISVEEKTRGGIETLLSTYPDGSPAKEQVRQQISDCKAKISKLLARQARIKSALSKSGAAAAGGATAQAAPAAGGEAQVGAVPATATATATSAGAAAATSAVPPMPAAAPPATVISQQTLDEVSAAALQRAGGQTPVADVPGDYLAAQSAVAVRLTTVLHAERVFLSQVYALDKDTDKLVTLFQQRRAALRAAVNDLATLCAPVLEQQVREDIRSLPADASAAISAAVNARASARQACVTVLTVLVDVLARKKALYRQRLQEMQAAVTELFSMHAATEGNPLVDSHNNNAFNGISAALYDLHAAIQAQINQLLSSGKEGDLLSTVTYGPLVHVDEEHSRYTALLHEHIRVAAMSGDADSAWAALVANRVKALELQDKRDDLVRQLKTYNRRKSISLEGTNAESNAKSRATIVAHIDAVTDEMETLDEAQRLLRAKLRATTYSDYPEALAVRPAGYEHFPSHIAQGSVVKNRTIDQYSNAEEGSLFGAREDPGVGRMMRFEGHLCVVHRVDVSTADRRKRLDKEVLLPLRSSHTCVAAVEAAFLEEAVAYVQSPCYSGTLRKWFVSLDVQRRRDPKEANDSVCRTFRGILSGLAHLHAHDVPHRDIRPKTVCIDATGQPVLTCFGRAPANAADLAKARGTLRYIAPELRSASSILEVDRTSAFAADVWAVGVLLFEAFFGATAWPADDNWQTPENKTTADDLAPGLWDTLTAVLAATPELRPVAGQALLYPFFNSGANLIAPSQTLSNRMAARDAAHEALVTARLERAASRSKEEVVFNEETLVVEALAHFAADDAVPSTRRFATPARDSEGYVDPIVRALRSLPTLNDVFEVGETGVVLPAVAADVDKVRAAGRLVAHGVAEGLLLPFPIASAVFEYLTGREPKDMPVHEAVRHAEVFAPSAVALSLRNALASKLDKVTGKRGSALVPGFSNDLLVIDANKAEGVCAAAQHFLVDSRRASLEAFRAGLLSLPELAEHLPLLHASDAAALVAGPPAPHHGIVGAVNVAVAGAGGAVPATTEALIMSYLLDVSEDTLRMFRYQCTGVIAEDDGPGTPRGMPIRMEVDAAHQGPPVFHIMPDVIYVVLHEYTDERDLIADLQDAYAPPSAEELAARAAAVEAEKKRKEQEALEKRQKEEQAAAAAAAAAAEEQRKAEEAAKAAEEAEAERVRKAVEEEAAALAAAQAATAAPEGATAVEPPPQGQAADPLDPPTA